MGDIQVKLVDSIQTYARAGVSRHPCSHGYPEFEQAMRADRAAWARSTVQDQESRNQYPGLSVQDPGSPRILNP